MTASLDDRFATAMGQLLGPTFPPDIALAVSGGGDSMAMLTLAHNWTHRWGVRLWVVTVDHGLRPESGAEAAMVADECRALGWPHATLRWDWDGTGNKMDSARRARLELIGRWRGGIAHVLMAHTRDDVAETFLMRLKRGAGVDGLAAMRDRRRVRIAPTARGLDMDGDMPPADIADPGPGREDGAFDILRPCLDMGREELRHYLRVLKGRWVDDPSNDDPGYDRTRMRRLLRVLDQEGLGPETLAASARRLRLASTALAIRAQEAWRGIGQEGQSLGAPTGELLIDRDGWAQVESDTQFRILSVALQYVSSAEYRPRAAPVEALRKAMNAGRGGTLHGCEVAVERTRIRIFREVAALEAASETVAENIAWDGRWRIFHPDYKGLCVRALGEDGWRQVKDPAPEAPPHRSARSLPSIWDGDRLVACDALGVGPGETMQFCPLGRAHMSFTQALLSH